VRRGGDSSAGCGLAHCCFLDLFACRLAQDGRLEGEGDKKERKYTIRPCQTRDYFAGLAGPRRTCRSP
jgi:hypothetical protein